jgi:hypothetical protein
MGLLFPDMGIKGAALLALSLVLVAMSMIPIKWALFICLLYIGFEGFLKIISDYHPVVHIGSDILVIFLFLRILTRMFSRGNPLPDYFPPLVGLFCFHFIWVVITLFNPYSLGVVASIAGSKIYVTMLLLFFFAYYNTHSVKDFHFFLKAIIFVAIVHTVFGLYQASVGVESVLSLHPRYAIQLEKYRNTAFRPFGLTNLPGGPAIYLAPVVPLALYLALTYKGLVRWFLIAFCASGASLVLICQIRSALLKLILGLIFFAVGYVAIAVRSRSKMRFGLGSILAGSVFLAIIIPRMVDFTIDQNEENKTAVERSLTLFDIDKISGARKATWERFIVYLKEVPFGAGFARVGAAGGAFQHLQASDPFFTPHYFFADNFWIATLIEVGLPGMFVLTFLVIGILIKGYRGQRKVVGAENRLAMFVILGVLIPMVLGLYAAEGILYNPDAAFFWFLSGMMLKFPMIDKSERQMLETSEVF